MVRRGPRFRYSDRPSRTGIEDLHNFQRRGAEPKTGTCPMTNPKRPLGWGMRRSLARLSAVAQSRTGSLPAVERLAADPDESCDVVERDPERSRLGDGVHDLFEVHAKLAL